MVSDASPGRWTNHSFIWLMCLPIVHAHRIGTWNFPIIPLLTEIWGETVVGFWWFWGGGTSEMQLVRQNLGKKTHPNHGSRRCHTVAMLPPPPAPPHTTISQHAARQIYVVKTREYYCFYYLLAILRHDASLTCHACVFSGCGWWKPVILIGLINRVGWLKSIGLFRITGFQEINS